MICKVISTGTEIMNGTIVDTNSNYIMKRLYELGIEVEEAISISDREELMGVTIKNTIENSNLIFIIGGLGPTEDDHTKNIVAKTLQRDLLMDQSILEGLENRYFKRGIKMPENNAQQALVIEGSIILENELGTAPGLFVEDGNKKIFLYPGPPREMIPMFEKSIKYLGDRTNLNNIETINTIGIGESSLELVLKKIDRPSDLEVLTYAKDRRVDIQILYKDSINKSIINEYIARLNKELSDFIYGHNCNSLEEIFLNRAKDKVLKLSLAESCTGGLISSRLTDIPGASKVLERGLVTYTNKAKLEELGVNKLILDRFGAVSEQTALEMAEGVRRKTNTDLGISVTGVAGPGMEEDKEEGLIYIGVSTLKDSYARRFNFKGDRKDIKNMAASQALIEGIKAIEKINNIEYN